MLVDREVQLILLIINVRYVYGSACSLCNLLHINVNSAIYHLLNSFGGKLFKETTVLKTEISKCHFLFNKSSENYMNQCSPSSF